VNPRRPGAGALTGSPMLVGAVTVLVTIIAVFLSYNANEGLPFVPSYPLEAEVPDAAGLVRGNEVRIGGARAGVVSEISTRSHRDGSVSAVLKLELEPSLRPLPADSTLMVRPRSALGLKYVEITKGRSGRGFDDDATIPVENLTAQPVEIDEVFNMFDGPTRSALSSGVVSYGTALAGRGEDLNRAFAGFEPLLRELEPAMHNLASERTGLARLFPALEQAAAQVAPVADVQASMFVALDSTFEALDSVREPLQESISGGPPALDAAIENLPAQRPFLAASEELLRRFRPGFTSLAGAAPDLSAALAAGRPSLERSPALSRRLTRTLEVVERFGADPRVSAGLDRLTRTAGVLRPLSAFVAPAQTRCNYAALLFRNLASTLSESDSVGSMLRFVPLAMPILPGSEAGPAATPANGPAPPPGTSARELSLTDDSLLHSNLYPNTAAPGQVPECEAGNEDYSGLHNRQAIGNPPGNQGETTERTRRLDR
jgi:ABC-type transporter Mla subunit MlaD